MAQNKLSTHKTFADKERAYRADCVNGTKLVMAYRSDGTAIPLVNCTPSQVEFIGGMWRVQNPFSHNIQIIRDKEMVLLRQLPHSDHVLFDYYDAAIVGYNCYGPYISGNRDYIVAKYTTDHGVYWGYGKTIEQARAFLGIKLYDEYMGLIHEHACKNQLTRQKK